MFGSDLTLCRVSASQRMRPFRTLPATRVRKGRIPWTQDSLQLVELLLGDYASAMREAHLQWQH
jgi:hypothetical protein